MREIGEGSNVGPEHIWKWSFRILLAAHLLTWIVSFPFILPLGPTLGMPKGPQRAVGLIALVSGFSVVAVETAVVAGYLVSHAAFLYQSLLLVLISIAFSAFVLLLVGLRR